MGSVFVALILVLVFEPIFPTVAATPSVNSHPCSALTVQTDKGDYVLGERVNITFTFHSLLPGCMEPMIAHDYVVQIQVLNVSNQTVYSSTQVATSTLLISETWTPTSVGEYTITATSYFRLLGDEPMTKTLQASTTIRVRDPAQQILEFGLMGIGVLGVAVASLGILLFKRRRKSNFKTI